MYNSTVNISQTVTVRETLLLPASRKSDMGFRLPDLNLTLAYSEDQLGSWNGVLPNFQHSRFFKPLPFRESVDDCFACGRLLTAHNEGNTLSSFAISCPVGCCRCLSMTIFKAIAHAQWAFGVKAYCTMGRVM